jgi:hypothetical protein
MSRYTIYLKSADVGWAAVHYKDGSSTTYDWANVNDGISINKDDISDIEGISFWGWADFGRNYYTCWIKDNLKDEIIWGINHSEWYGGSYGDTENSQPINASDIERDYTVYNWNSVWAYLPVFVYNPVPPEAQTYTVEPIISSRPDRTAWAWIFQEDTRNKLINSTDLSQVSCSATMTIIEFGEITSVLEASNTLDSGVLCVDEGFHHLNCKVDATIDEETGLVMINKITFDAMFDNLDAGIYQTTLDIKVDNGDGLDNAYYLTVENNEIWEGGSNYVGSNSGIGGVISEPTFAIPEKPTYNNVMKVSADFIAKPNCVCYLNSELEKPVSFTFDVQNIKFEPPNIEGLSYTNTYFRILMNNAKWIVRLYEKDSDTILAERELEYTIDTLDYTFTLPENTKKDYEIKLICNLNGTEYEIGNENIIIERQQYCHSLNIEVKTYDMAGNEIDKFPHPTSADWDEALHSEITVKINITDEQKNYIDVPVENLFTNWQYSITGSNGQYEMKIPNSSVGAPPINDYIISLYINKDWTVENGYYNKYIIEAENILINSDKIEKVGLWNNEHIDHYSNGITYLDGVYEKVSGLFVNSMKQFSIVDSLNEVNERKQYSYCYRVYDAPMTLNLPNYTEDELADIAKAIVRELGQPRKIETYTILSKEIPKINSNITLNHNGALLSLPVYTVEFSLSNSNISIQIKNDELKLMKDYLQNIK